MIITFIGLTITSSWGNGHATTFRGLLCELASLGLEVHFLEHNMPYYEKERDLPPEQPYKVHLYNSLEDLTIDYQNLVGASDFVIVGSYVQHGPAVIDWVMVTAPNVTAFYDIDTPVTLDKLRNGDDTYIRPDQVSKFDMYLSFSGGKALDILMEEYNAQKALPLYCSANPETYCPLEEEKQWLAGYLGTYSEDRQTNLNNLLLAPAELMPASEFVIAGPGFPEMDSWPKNVEWIPHLAPDQHAKFYNRQVVTINVTRKAMRDLGYSPSVRLFEAAACGIPIISDEWEGLSSFFEIDKEIFICNTTLEVMHLLENITPDELVKVGTAARQRVLREHTAAHRAKQLIAYYK